MDLSIIIVSYNVSELLKNCLDSIFKFTSGIKFEIIVVDNKSSDNSVEMLKSFGDRIKLVEAGDNVGFAKGNNLGIKEAKGTYLLFLNPDTLLIENSLKAMFNWMETHTEYAVSSCQTLDSEHKISPTGGYLPTLLKITAWTFFLDDLFNSDLIGVKINSYHPHAGKLYEKEGELDWVTGAFMMVRRLAMTQVGNFDENFFIYGEELEWCIRFKQAGWKIGYTPATKFVHLERKSSGGLPRNAVLGEFKGLKYIYAKHYSGWPQMVVGTLLDCAAFLRIIFWLLRLKPQMAKIYVEALLI